ncbi:hypothetical protein V866_003616 [Kwoniella sp. B9012]
MSNTQQSTSTSIDNSVNESSQPDDDSITVRRNSTVPTAANTKIQFESESRSQDEGGKTKDEVDKSKESHTESGSGSIKRKKGRRPMSEDEKIQRERDRQMRNLFIRK